MGSNPTRPTKEGLALQLLAVTFVRTVELRNAEWRIPAEKMKMRSEHIVPLSTQALDVLRQLRELNGNWQLVFSSVAKSELDHLDLANIFSTLAEPNSNG